MDTEQVRLERPLLDDHGSVYSNSAISKLLITRWVCHSQNFQDFITVVYRSSPSASKLWLINDNFPSLMLLSTQNLWIQSSTCRAIDSRDLEEEKSEETAYAYVLFYFMSLFFFLHFYEHCDICTFRIAVVLLGSQKCSAITTTMWRDTINNLVSISNAHNHSSQIAGFALLNSFFSGEECFISKLIIPESYETTSKRFITYVFINDCLLTIYMYITFFTSGKLHPGYILVQHMMPLEWK